MSAVEHLVKNNGRKIVTFLNQSEVNLLRIY